MNINTQNILADAISDVGSWHWWLTKDDMVQVQFCDIMLYTGCDDVGFIVGGDETEVVGRKGKYTEEEIETAYKKWWDYWRRYLLRIWEMVALYNYSHVLEAGAGKFQLA